MAIGKPSAHAESSSREARWACSAHAAGACPPASPPYHCELYPHSVSQTGGGVGKDAATIARMYTRSSLALSPPPCRYGWTPTALAPTAPPASSVASRNG